jgi:hypothetical protein
MAAELGLPMPKVETLCLPHVITPAQFRCLVAPGIGRIDHKARRDVGDAVIGKAISSAVQVVVSALGPAGGGVLVFFPSFAMLRASAADQWAFTAADGSAVPVFTEGAADSRPGHKRARQQALTDPAAAFRDALATPEPQATTQGGSLDAWAAGGPKAPKSASAVLVAVCRGKLSEGADLPGNLVRGVVLVGVPFPAAKAPDIVLKQTYNQAERISCPTSSLPDRFQWYTAEAMTAVNQALGRVVRGWDDWGVAVLLDSRWATSAMQQHLSPWVRQLTSVVGPQPRDQVVGPLSDQALGALERAVREVVSANLGVSRERPVFQVSDAPPAPPALAAAPSADLPGVATSSTQAAAVDAPPLPLPPDPVAAEIDAVAAQSSNLPSGACLPHGRLNSDVDVLTADEEALLADLSFSATSPASPRVPRVNPQPPTPDRRHPASPDSAMLPHPEVTGAAVHEISRSPAAMSTTAKQESSFIYPSAIAVGQQQPASFAVSPSRAASHIATPAAEPAAPPLTTDSGASANPPHAQSPKSGIRRPPVEFQSPARGPAASTSMCLASCHCGTPLFRSPASVARDVLLVVPPSNPKYAMLQEHLQQLYPPGLPGFAARSPLAVIRFVTGVSATTMWHVTGISGLSHMLYSAQLKTTFSLITCPSCEDLLGIIVNSAPEDSALSLFREAAILLWSSGFSHCVSFS